MKASFCKLEEYKIIEYDTGELSWEAHFGLGSHQEGRCFKKGSILFIGPPENERPGYLKLEYIDHLKKLPDWQKTDYYCTSLDVYHCDTGKSVSKEEMNLWKYDRRLYEKEKAFLDHNSVSMNNISTLKSQGDIAYRLHRHEIIIQKNGQIIWSSYSGHSSGFKISHGLAHQLFSERISAAFQSLFKSETDRGNGKQPFQLNQLDIPKNDTLFYASSFKTLLFGTTGFILMIILLIFLFLFGHLKGYSDNRNYNKKEHPSRHRMNR